MLTGIQESDLGTYRCDVTNDAGTGSANITITQEGSYINLTSYLFFFNLLQHTINVLAMYLQLYSHSP